MDSQNCSRCNLTAAEQHAHHMSTRAGRAVSFVLRSGALWWMRVPMRYLVPRMTKK
jgi:hypothetical protein